MSVCVYECVYECVCMSVCMYECVCLWQSHNITVHISAAELSSCQFQPCVCGASRHVTQHGAHSHVILSICLLQCANFFLEVTLL